MDTVTLAFLIGLLGVAVLVLYLYAQKKGPLLWNLHTKVLTWRVQRRRTRPNELLLLLRRLCLMHLQLLPPRRVGAAQ